MNIRNAGKIGIATAAVMMLTSQLAHAGNPVYVGQRVAASQQVSMDRVDHAAWDRIVRKYVDKDGLVNYRALKASQPDMQALDGYLNLLSTASTRTTAERNSKLAFWINAYNAVTVKGILQKYPTTSIRNHTAALGGYNLWKDLQLIVGGTPISLDSMEHKVLRKMSEPRIHFAIVCASIGCPRLLNQAYVPQKLNEQLDVNTKDFFSRSQNFKHSGNRIQLSAIMNWFKGDFGSNQAAQLATISPWLPTAAAQSAAKSGRVSVSYLSYDWKLNEQVRSATASSGTKATSSGSGAKKQGSGRR